jgi:hypothetical protein
MARSWVATAAVVVVIAGCGGPPDGEVVRPATCDAVVMGACVVSQAQPYDTRFIERSIRGALAYWNAPPDTLEGWAIVYGTEQIDCGATPGASGCAWWDENRTIALQVLDPDCPETAQLVHEIGHVLFRDGGHSGPWWNWAAEQNATWELVRTAGASPGCAESRYYVTRQ